jgi:RNA polymerase sigma-70 factor (ECF subfamily)
MATLETDRSIKEIFDTYSVDILAYAASLLKNKDDAKDALQEVFIRFINSRNGFKEDCSIKTWLLIITRNYCYTKLRQKKAEEVSLDESFLKSESISIESRVTLQEALARLPKEEYELLYLKEVAGYSCSEISSIMDISVPNVKIKLFRIRQHLKELLS